MSKTNHQVPRVLNIASWAMAVVGAFVFSSAVGLVAYNMVQNPISASQTVQSQCAENSQATLNNWPKELDAGANYSKLFDSSTPPKRWYCSIQCISGYDKTKAYNDPANKKALDDYFATSTVGGGKPIIYETYKDFNEAVKAGKVTSTEMENVIIRQGLDTPATDSKNATANGKKKVCEGISEDYIVKDKDQQEVTPAVKNDTYAAYVEAQKQQEAAAAASPQPAGGTAAEGIFRAPVAVPAGNTTGPVTNNTQPKVDYNDLAYKCLKALKNELSGESSPNSKFNWDYAITYYQYIRTKLYRDHERQYKECQALLKKVRKESSGTTEPDAVEPDAIAPSTASTETTKYSIYGTVKKDNGAVAASGYACIILKDSKNSNIDASWLTRRSKLDSEGKFYPIVFSPEEIKAHDTIFMFAYDNGGTWGGAQMAKVEKSTQNLFKPRTGGYAVYNFSPVLYKVPFTMGMRLPIAEHEWYACNAASAK